jgi:hypothetical protein
MNIDDRIDAENINKGNIGEKNIAGDFSIFYDNCPVVFVKSAF